MAEKECKRKNERGNEQVRKKSKNTGFSKTKEKYTGFFFFLKETQIRDKPKHGEEAKQEVKGAKTLFLTIYC